MKNKSLETVKVVKILLLHYTWSIHIEKKMVCFDELLRSLLNPDPNLIRVPGSGSATLILSISLVSGQSI